MPLLDGGAAAEAAIFLLTISSFIGFPSNWTLLYLLTAAKASARCEKTTSAVPCERIIFMSTIAAHMQLRDRDNAKLDEHL